MRQRKLWITYLLMGTIAASLLAGCGNQGTDFQPAKETAQEDTGREAVEPMQATETAQADSDGSGILIAYFAVAENSNVDAVSSASMVTVNGEAEGRIQHLAKLIQKETGGELFSIQTSVDYPGDGGKLIDYAAEEQGFESVLCAYRLKIAENRNYIHRQKENCVWHCKNL